MARIKSKEDFMSYSKEELSHMSPEERRQVYRDCQQQLKDTGNNLASTLKDTKEKKGIGGIILGAIGLGLLGLLGGGS